jgi:putative Holliday junction resolvase
VTTPEGTLIGFDFGERRIGVAVLEPALGTARALAVIEASSNQARFEAIDRIDSQWQPAAFVVGQPKHADGSVHPVAQLAAKFGRRLAARYRKPVMLVDETLSSAEAQSRVRDEQRDIGVDAVAAEIILQSYFDHPSHAQPVA